MARRPRRCRRKACPECGAHAALVRYEPVLGGGVVTRPPIELRCTNRECDRYWR